MFSGELIFFSLEENKMFHSTLDIFFSKVSSFYYKKIAKTNYEHLEVCILRQEKKKKHLSFLLIIPIKVIWDYCVVPGGSTK